MPSHNLINVKFGIIFGSVSRFHTDKVGRLSHPIQNNPHGVMMSPSIWKTKHEVHINGLTFKSQNLNICVRLQE